MTASDHFDGFFCPACQVALRLAGTDGFQCDDCDRVFPIIAGIPDFRLDETSSAEARKVQQLLERFATSSFMDLVQMVGAEGTPDDLVELDQAYEAHNVARGEERVLAISQLTNRPVGGALCLDIGCGTAGPLVALAASFDHGIGLDIAMTDLILARKLFEEHGITNVTLVCSSAASLPFAPNKFDLINSTDVIEHVQDQRRFLLEAYRVMTPDGAFCYNTPNRFSIFGEEPHVKLWGVGFLPRKWMGRYVQLRKGIDWYDADVRLLSRGELTKMMTEIPNARFEIHGPILDHANADWSFKRRIASRVPFVVPVVNRALKSVVPSFQVVLTKETDPSKPAPQ